VSLSVTVAVFQLLLGPICRLVDAVNMAMMRSFDSAIQVSEKLDKQFVANIQYKVGVYNVCNTSLSNASVPWDQFPRSKCDEAVTDMSRGNWACETCRTRMLYEETAPVEFGRV